MQVTQSAGFGRKLILMVGASAFLSVQLWLQDKDWTVGGAETWVAIGGMALWGLTMLFMVGPWMWPSSLNDERTDLTRHRAFFFGYMVMMIAALGFLALAMTGRVDAPEAAHLTLAIGVAAPLYGFAFLD